jgi:hypothetical protein
VRDGDQRSSHRRFHSWTGSNTWPLPCRSDRAEFRFVTFNFGQIESGQVIHHDYIFTNTGSQTLTIRDVRPILRLHDDRPLG